VSYGEVLVDKVKWSALRWSSCGQKCHWPYTEGTWLYCDYL